MSSPEGVALLDRFYEPEHPDLGSGPLPIEPYVSESYFNLERIKIFQDAWLLACHETLFIMKTYAKPAKSWSQRIGQELSIIFLREGVAEDLSTLESTQQGLQSGALESMVLSDQEIAIRHQHHMVERCIKGGSSSEGPPVKAGQGERKPA